MEIVRSVFDFIHEWAWIPLVLIYLGVIGSILLENRNVSKALAYLIVLFFLPGLGLIIFYFFGRDFRKKRKFRKKERLERIRSSDFFQKILYAQPDKIHYLDEKFHNLSKPTRILIKKENSLIFNNNRVTLLKNGEQKFPEVIQEMKRAQSHIHLEYYMLSYDDVGKAILDTVVEKHKEGVEIRIMVDGAGSSNLGRIPKILKKEGIPFYKFMPVTFTNLASSNYRNHRKTLIIDGKVGFLGGINLDDRYLNNGKHDLYWRDTHLKIEGPAVDRLQFEFMMDWNFVSSESLPFEEPYYNVSERYDNGVMMTIAGSGPTSSRPHGMDTMVSLIHNSLKSIKITNPYFIPSDELRSALITASNSGVKVELIIPGKSDSLVVQRASFSYLTEMLENGIDVYLYEKGFVHAKTMVVDGKVSFVGTLNTDIRSFYINFETAAIVYDESITKDLEALFEQDKLDSKHLKYDQWVQRSVWSRLLDSFFRLLTPLL